METTKKVLCASHLFLLFLLFLGPVFSFADSEGVFRGQLAADLSHPIQGLSWNKDAATQEPTLYKCKPLTGAKGAEVKGAEKENYCVQLQGEYASKTLQLKPNARSFKLEPSGKFTKYSCNAPFIVFRTGS